MANTDENQDEEESITLPIEMSNLNVNAQEFVPAAAATAAAVEEAGTASEEEEFSSAPSPQWVEVREPWPVDEAEAAWPADIAGTVWPADALGAAWAIATVRAIDTAGGVWPAVIEGLPAWAVEAVGLSWPAEAARPAWPADAAGPAWPAESAGLGWPDEAAGPGWQDEAAGPGWPDEAARPPWAAEAARLAWPAEAAGPVWLAETAQPAWPAEAAQPAWQTEAAEPTWPDDVTGFAGRDEVTRLAWAVEATGLAERDEATGFAGTGETTGSAGTDEATEAAWPTEATEASRKAEATGLAGTDEAKGLAGTNEATGLAGTNNATEAAWPDEAEGATGIAEIVPNSARPPDEYFHNYFAGELNNEITSPSVVPPIDDNTKSQDEMWADIPEQKKMNKTKNFQGCSEYGHELELQLPVQHAESVPEPGTSQKKQSSSDEKNEANEPKLEETATPKKLPLILKSMKEHVNLVLIGHVDAGKSTIGGQIMSLTGMVEKRTLDKYEKQAREMSRETWYLSWALDISEEERDKGKTVEVGRAYFETKQKHFTILDAPGHKSFVPNMIGGAAQADLACLVISARKGEFETGFERGGQTREHAMLVRSAGVQHLVVLITKMDDQTVLWDENRYTYCCDNLLPFLKLIGFNPEKDLSFLPVSGQTGQGLLEQVSKDVCPWYRGPSFIQLIDDLPSLNRIVDGPFIMPIADKYKEMGTVLMGKVEAGVTYTGSTLILMPNKVQVTVDQIWSDNNEVTCVGPGENIKIKLKGIEEEEVSLGFVLCDHLEPITAAKLFDAQFVILDNKSIICAGYSAVMHIHCAMEDVTVKLLICLLDKKTGEKSQVRPRFVKPGQVVIMRLECARKVCMEPFKKFRQLGRITIRDENRTIAVGKVLKIIS